MHVVLVAGVRDDDARGAVQPGRVADEDHLRAGCDEAVDEVLRERVVDLVLSNRCAELPVESRLS